MVCPDPKRWCRWLITAVAFAISPVVAAQQDTSPAESATGGGNAVIGRDADGARNDSPGEAEEAAVALPGEAAGDAGEGDSTDEQADAEALLRQALQLRGAGRLPQAAVLLQQAMNAAGDDAGLRSRIHRELYFHLPVLEAQRLLLLSRPAQARRVVEQAIEYNRHHAAESEQLREFLRNIRRLESRDAGQTAGSSVLHEVGDRLNAFRRRQGRYPSGYTELNQILPAERPPLEYFDIVYYSAGDDTFTLRLRSRVDPDRTLTLHQTGLLQ